MVKMSSNRVQDFRRYTTATFTSADKKVIHEYTADKINWRVLDCDHHCEEVVLCDVTTLKVMLKEPGPLHVLVKPGVHVMAKGGSMKCVITDVRMNLGFII